MPNYNENIYKISDFNFQTMVPQHSVEERRMEKVLRKFSHHIPLFYISPADANDLNALAIRLHIYRGPSTTTWNRSVYDEFRAIVPRSVFAAATDEDLARWVHETIQRAQNGYEPNALNMETLVTNYWRRVKVRTGGKILVAKERVRKSRFLRSVSTAPIKFLLIKGRQRRRKVK